MEIQDIIKDARIITEDTTFAEALELMVRTHTNSLLVVDESGKLSGEVSVADLFDAIIPFDVDGDSVLEHFSSEEQIIEAIKKAKDTPVDMFMSVDLDAMHPDEGLLQIAATAIANQRSRIPVVDHEDRPIGIISRQGLKRILGSYLKIKE
jgi:CBS domain-containing protein